MVVTQETDRRAVERAKYHPKRGIASLVAGNCSITRSFLKLKIDTFLNDILRKWQRNVD